MNVIINVPDQIGEAINRLPNRGGEVDMYELRKIFEKYEQSLKETTTSTKQKGKWAKFAEKAHKESPLKGMSEELNKLSREFRDEFAFNHDV